jgi:putative ABC transport system permease protein
MIMIRNFFTTSLRHLLKNKSYALLNILGLSIGLACFTLIALWVKDELSYDKFHSKADRIYRVANLFTDESGEFEQAVTPVPLAPALIADLPEVEDAVRIDANGVIVQRDDKKFNEADILAVDPSFFKIFDFKLISGNVSSALREPYSIVLSESLAKKYFGNADPLGESLRLFLFDPDGNGAEYKVTGIAQDCPRNSHFSYQALVSFSTLEARSPEEAGEWMNNGYYTYVLLKPNTDHVSLNAKLATFLEKYIGKEMKQYKIYWSYFLQPVGDIHLHSHLRYEIKNTSSLSYVFIFGSIGVIVLLLACINYINLSTAYSANRFKEVGVRKVMGAYKNNLVFQYLTESWLLAIVSLIVAITWIELARPLFESLTGKQVTNLYTIETLASLFGIASLAGLLSGIYPSLVISSFKTVNVLKGQFKSGKSGIWLRKALVVFQYTITIILITGIIVVQLQLRFIQEKDLGFNEENLLIMNVNGDIEVINGFEGFQQELLSAPEIAGIARSNSMIAGGLSNSGAVAEHSNGKTVGSTIFRMRVDHDYIDTYGMKIIAGRNFIKGSAADSTKGFIVNDATTKLYGYQQPGDMIGKKMNFDGIDGEIIGVVKDFHYNSLQKKIEPTCMFLLNGNFSRIAVRLNGNLNNSIEKVTDTWRKYYPDSILDYAFAEDRLQDQYQSEQRFSKIFLVFSGISLAIACLGLFSLVSYALESRTKEIGMRKVLGAPVLGIVTLLSSEFLLLILISCFIATPAAWYFMQQWLQGFAFRISIEPWIFVAAGVIALLIALATISIKSIRSALVNPIDSLRNE